MILGRKKNLEIKKSVTNVKHIGGYSKVNPNELPKELRDHLQQVGVTKKDFKNPEKVLAILDYLESIGRIKREINHSTDKNHMTLE